MRRAVFFAPGFDPRDPAYYHRVLAREGAGRLTAGPVERAGDRVFWEMAGAGVALRLEVLRHDREVAAALSGPGWARLADGALWACEMWREGRFGPRGPGTRGQRRLFRYPVWASLASMVLAVGLLALLASALATLGGPDLVAPAAAAGPLVAVWRAGRWNAWLYHLFFFGMWRAFQRIAEGRAPEFDAANRAAAARVAEAAADADEVWVIGHSLGAARAAEVVAALPEGTGAALLTLGSVRGVLACWAGPGSVALDAAEAACGARAGLSWLDVGWRGDPFAAGPAPPATLRITERSRFAAGPIFQPRRPPRPLRRHLGYLMAPEAGPFDLYRMLADPRPVASQLAELRRAAG
ncbi:MAG: hypothetical protein AAFW69_05645 [Pseudomonadota bacterium]